MLEHRQRSRVDIVDDIALGPRIGAGEEMIEKPDLGLHAMGGGDPMEGPSHLAPVGRVAAPGRGIVGATQFGHHPAIVLDHVGTGDEIGVPQPDLAPRRQAEELLRRVLHEVVPLDVDLARKRHGSRAGGGVLGIVDGV